MHSQSKAIPRKEESWNAQAQNFAQTLRKRNQISRLYEFEKSQRCSRFPKEIIYISELFNFVRNKLERIPLKIILRTQIVLE